MQVCEIHKKVTNLTKEKYFTLIAQHMNPIMQSLYYSVQSADLKNWYNNPQVYDQYNSTNV